MLKESHCKTSLDVATSRQSYTRSMFELSKAYKKDGMYAYSQLQEREFKYESDGFRAAKHQSFVGAGYFDAVQNTIMAGDSSTTAMGGSTEEEQFENKE